MHWNTWMLPLWKTAAFFFTLVRAYAAPTSKFVMKNEWMIIIIVVRARRSIAANLNAVFLFICTRRSVSIYYGISVCVRVIRLDRRLYIIILSLPFFPVLSRTFIQYAWNWNQQAHKRHIRTIMPGCLHLIFTSILPQPHCIHISVLFVRMSFYLFLFCLLVLAFLHHHSLWQRFRPLTLENVLNWHWIITSPLCDNESIVNIKEKAKNQNKVVLAHHKNRFGFCF